MERSALIQQSTKGQLGTGPRRATPLTPLLESGFADVSMQEEGEELPSVPALGFPGAVLAGPPTLPEAKTLL